MVSSIRYSTACPSSSSEQEIRGKIKSAMVYPILVLVFAFIMVIVLHRGPAQVQGNIRSMNVDTANHPGAVHHGRHLAQLLVYRRDRRNRGLLRAEILQEDREGVADRLVQLKVPVMGSSCKNGRVTVAETFATLIESGVPMMRSLEIVSETAGNRVIAHAIDSARNAIREGQKISAPLAASGLFPAMVTHMIDIGEETGRLSDMLSKVSDFYDSEVDNAVKALTSMIEPCLIVVMGGLVGFIAISIMAPIFKLISAVAG